MIGILLFMAVGFVVGWAFPHPLAYLALVIPIGFAIAAGGDLAVVPTIIGLALTAAAVYAGQVLAKRREQRRPPEEAAAEQ